MDITRAHISLAYFGNLNIGISFRKTIGELDPSLWIRSTNSFLLVENAVKFRFSLFRTFRDREIISLQYDVHNWVFFLRATCLLGLRDRIRYSLKPFLCQNLGGEVFYGESR